MGRLNKALRTLTRKPFHAFKEAINMLFPSGYAQESYSQYGEDMILRAIYERYPNSYKGYYIDVGAYHPKKYSNSYYFYRKGWNGICIDPSPTVSRLFKLVRPHDLFLGIGISEKEGSVPFLLYAEPGYNTFLQSTANHLPYKPIKEICISCMPLSLVLKKYLPDTRTIDFLSVDAEGMDFEVLRSNDWDQYRPRIVLIESLEDSSLETFLQSEIAVFMRRKNYQLMIRIPSGLFFFDAEYPGFDGSPFLNHMAI